MTALWKQNSAFRDDYPLQMAWDSTSYSALKTCPFKYYLSVVEGFQPRKISIHLRFGLAFHYAMERYHKLRAEGTSHDDALLIVVAQMYFRQLLPHHELYCGGDSEPAKTPHTLLRTIVWYLDEHKDDPATTFKLTNGRPAVELSFTLPLDKDFTYGGHFDRIVEFSGRLWCTDYKTTKNALDVRFFSQFLPSIQMAGYTIASQIVFDTPAKGVIIDGIQLGVTFSRFARQQVQFSPSQLDEFLADLRLDLKIAKIYAQEGSWPMNPTACHHYGGCSFRRICSHSPQVRPNFLAADFVKRMWNPLEER